MKVTLIPLGDGPTIEVDQPVLLVGRHPECDVMLESRKVSRRHCCLALVNRRLIVRDLRSTNGVRVNGRRVTESEVHEGDELAIANVGFRVQHDGDSPLAPQAAELSSDQPIVLYDEAVAEAPLPPPTPQPGPAKDDDSGEIHLIPGSQEIHLEPESDPFLKAKLKYEKKGKPGR